MKTEPDDAEPARDAHLLAALRHAPDHDAAPPAALSARILERARAAVASQPPPTHWHGAWRRALLLWREPQRVAAFATLAVALLLGLLWGSQEPPSSPPPQAQAPEPAAAEAPPAGAVPPVERAATKSLADNADKAPPAAREPAAPSPRTAAAPPAVPQRPPAAALPPAAAPPPAALPPPAAPPPAETAAAVTAPAEPAPARSEAATGSAAPATAQRDVSADAAQERRRDAPAALGKLAAAPSREPTFSRVDALLAGDGTTLSWQRGANASAHGEVQRRWWALLRETTRGAWRRGPAGEPASATPWVTLLEAGRPTLVLWQSDGSLVLRDDAGVLWRATPDAAQLQALRQASEGW